eukprot:scaffold83490_cov21-Tisochrysis_lutea.AAC.1
MIHPRNQHRTGTTSSLPLCVCKLHAHGHSMRTTWKKGLQADFQHTSANFQHLGDPQRLCAASVTQHSQNNFGRAAIRQAKTSNTGAGTTKHFWPSSPLTSKQEQHRGRDTQHLLLQGHIAPAVASPCMPWPSSRPQLRNQVSRGQENQEQLEAQLRLVGL